MNKGCREEGWGRTLHVNVVSAFHVTIWIRKFISLFYDERARAVDVFSQTQSRFIHLILRQVWMTWVDEKRCSNYPIIWRLILNNKKFALTNVFESGNVISNSEFRRRNRIVFLTWGAELQLLPVTVLLKSTRFALARRSHQRFTINDLRRSIWLRFTE